MAQVVALIPMVAAAVAALAVLGALAVHTVAVAAGHFIPTEIVLRAAVLALCVSCGPAIHVRSHQLVQAIFN
jgi:hypothetical protein